MACMEALSQQEHQLQRKRAHHLFETVEQRQLVYALQSKITRGITYQCSLLMFYADLVVT